MVKKSSKVLKGENISNNILISKKYIEKVQIQDKQATTLINIAFAIGIWGTLLFIIYSIEGKLPTYGPSY